jgi:hypothetical protein
MNSKTTIITYVCHVRRLLAAALISLACLPTLATTFTNNTAISGGNTNYDGTDIIITNCTVTIDGRHSFSSVHVASGGILTHSSSSNGTITNILYVTNEPQLLAGTNLVTLDNSNVISGTVTVTDTAGTNFYTNGVDYLLSSPDGIVTQLQRTTNSTILDGSTVLVSYQSLLGTSASGLNLSIAGNLQVDVAGAINANGTGYGGGAGAGAGHSAGTPLDGSGGGYGGIGGTSSSNALGGTTYGSYAQPATSGSGGGAGYAGPGGAGGGLIEITAGGSLILNGSVSANGANGTNSRSGGGSGGSIWMTGLTLAGSGTVSAKGGAGEPTHGGGGGGGRIALLFNSSSFLGSMVAYGGGGATIGGAGTVFTRSNGQNGLLIVDNGGQLGTNTTLSVSDITVNALVRGNAGVMPTGAWSFGSLTVASNGLLLASPVTTMNLAAQGVITVEAGGGIVANGAGNGASQGGGGPGAGHFIGLSPYWPCGGGGYGGNGASGSISNNLGGEANGAQNSLSGYGSAGGSYLPYSSGGNGGGAIQISTKGILQVDGTISANGGNGSGVGGGGGSGGNISLNVGTLIGSGSISANGGSGAGSIGGGGGGGRILLIPTANLFTGIISAYGGGGGGWGGAGTVYFSLSGQNSQLILDNGGNLGTNTPVVSASGTDLIVRNGAIGSASSSASFGNLFVYSNAWLTPVVTTVLPLAPLTLTFSGNATVQSGGGIIADLSGYGAAAGLGPGRVVTSGNTNFCSGAGHGGYGGNSANNIAIGGLTYDNATSPATAGSGGGGSSPLSAGGSLGGTGGGVIRLSVTGTLELDGIISASGGNGSGYAGGGGSGGAIWLTLGTLAGGGSLTANGGSGVDSTGGGGAGGMIYVTCNSNLFSGALSTFGGSGASWGGEGTAIIQASGRNAQLVLDNGGHSGPGTTLPSISTMDVTLRDGAVGLLTSHITLGNLVISSNAWIFATNSAAGLQVSSATIQAGGGIIADGYGYPGGQGTGVGRIEGGAPNFPCGGAGHGGLGGASVGNISLGGNAYDTETSPTLMGSGGGSNQGISIGGAGGGVISVTATGLLQIDGIISANGLNGSGPGGGGGSGGSIKISAGTLAGGGVIGANGGSGAGSVGGGGAGGLIALTPVANLFAGTISAHGSGGANWGGAGTIFIQTNGGSGQLIVDNGGPAGAGTPIQTGSTSTSIILRNGAAAYQQFPPQTFASLTIGSNAVLEANPVAGNNYPGIVNLTLNQSATILAGGGIVTDGAGSGSGLGTGAGHYSSSSPFPGGGGGYGGSGGNGSGNAAAGGSAYGSVTSPLINGSGGGGYPVSSTGGAGGGQIHLTISGTLEISGRISANGVNGSGMGGGGGSGGSVLLSVGTLLGGGSITANGGAGVDSVGGGGGGGRIYVSCSTDDFDGMINAQGGGGYAYGGAGTIFTQVTSVVGGQIGQLLVDNGGQAGAITPLSQSLGLSISPFNLTIQNGGVVSPQSQVAFPVLNNLTVGAGGTLSGVSGLSTLDLMVLNSVDIAPGGLLAVDETGYGQANGPGMGLGAAGAGSGAGYGGAGGASTTIAGGASYGSALQPVDFGSGGGTGFGAQIGGSQGGGAVRLNVGGVLNIDGELSAEGGPGIQDNSGGGSGGSIWVTAGMLAGGGLVTADGGEGELYGGGGGAGGRIALYARTNVYYGALSAIGGAGDFPGGNGSIINSNNIPSFQIISNSPSGIVTSAVSAVTLFFNDAPNQTSVASSAISLTGPGGFVISNAFTISRLASASYLVSFPQQVANGTYTLSVGSSVADLYGQPLVPYTGTFTISLPVIQGTVTDTNGHPIAGVVLQGSGGGVSSTTTDTNGNYNLGFVPGSSFTVTPSSGTLVFSPASAAYTNVSTTVSNQNYVAVGSLATSLKGGINAGNFALQWQAIPSVSYQVYSSTNLVNWIPYGAPMTGSNGTVQVLVPIGTGPKQFFKVQSNH